jgi:hypothetical protein
MKQVWRAVAVAGSIVFAGQAPAKAESAASISFQSTETGVITDPTGLWSAAELAEGGSDVQPSVWHATFPIRGGEVTLAILVDAWCGMAECPFRYRIAADDGRVVASHPPGDFGMICQSREDMWVAPETGILHACAARIDLWATE